MNQWVWPNDLSGCGKRALIRVSTSTSNYSYMYQYSMYSAVEVADFVVDRHLHHGCVVEQCIDPG